MKIRILTAFGLLLTCYGNAQAQNSAPSRFELSFDVPSITLVRAQAERLASATDLKSTSKIGVGGRVTLNLNRALALEGEGDFFPRRTFPTFSSGGWLMQWHFGVKAGKRFKNFGFFAKALPGLSSYSEVQTIVGTQSSGPISFPIVESRHRTYFSFDLGGVLEFYPSRRFLTRLDVSDSMIRYPTTPNFSSLTPTPFSQPQIIHNYKVTAGVALRLGGDQPDNNVAATTKSEAKKEIGFQFSTLLFRINEHLHTLAGLPGGRQDTDVALGFGGRFSYDLTRNAAIELQGDLFPASRQVFNNARAGGRVVQVQAGAKLGKRFTRWGIFGKARPGVISFSRTVKVDSFDPNASPFVLPVFHVEWDAYFSMDAGGVLELYPSRRIVTRFDFGDTIIRYGAGFLPVITFPTTRLDRLPGETMHNFQFSAGAAWRF